MSKIFVVSAPSGAGKTTIVRSVLKKIPEIVFSISATTRKKRNHETDGVDYFFLTEDEFKKKIEAGQFVEWEKFYDYYYGTLKSSIDDTIAEGKSVLLEVDVKGAMNIKKVYPQAVMIFIAPPGLEELKNRLIKRQTESDEDLQKRLERAEMEMDFKDKFDYVIVNDHLDTAKEKVFNILKSELTKEE
jgi:guanylate kinase